MRVTLIHNPTAGDDRQPTVGQIEALMKEAGYKVRTQSTDDKGWTSALKKSADFVVVAGGDGTVGAVARRLIGKAMPIAVLPLGTANNISKTLGLADFAVTQLIPAWKSGRRLKFDAGLASGPWGERYFIEGIGTGLLPSSIPKISANKTLRQLSDTDVKVTYAQQMFREHVVKCRAVDIKAFLDGADISGRYVLFEVLNMQYVGPNLFLAPEVVPNNGEFEVILLEERHRDKLHAHIRNWQAGKLTPPQFATRRGSHLELHWTGFPLHIDDKIWPGKGDKQPKPPAILDIDVAPGAVEFLVPAEVHEMRELAKKSGDRKPARNSRHRK